MESSFGSERGSAAFLAAFLVVLLAAAFAIAFVGPPQPVSSDVPVQEFSAYRAFDSMLEIAAEPHPVPSPAHDRVRAFLRTKLVGLGLVVEVQETESDQPLSNGKPGKLRNIVAMLPGKESTGTVAIVSHYDSKPLAPGAADDGAAVAAMLETARALRTGEPLRNDLLFLFTDGEEVALLGAKAFAESHPLAKELKLFLNFEARGTSGRSLMFQATRPDGRLIREFGQVVRRPASNSIMAAVYERMPNDTDFTVLSKAGIPGLNFAFIEGYTRYHTAEDNSENLSLSSLQHHGDQMIALARHFGDADLTAPHEGRAVYFDFLGRWLIVYPMDRGWHLAGAAGLLFLIAALIGRKRGVVGLGGMLAAFFLHVVLVAATTAAVWGLTIFLVGHFEDDMMGPVRGTLGDPFFFAAFAVIPLGLASLLSGSARPKLGGTNLLAGAVLLWLALLAAGTHYLPESSFMFLVPAGIGAFALLLFVLPGTSPQDAGGGGLMAALLAVPALLLLVPFAREIFAAMALGGAWFVAPLPALLVALVSPMYGRGACIRLATLFLMVAAGLLTAGYLMA